MDSKEFLSWPDTVDEAEVYANDRKYVLHSWSIQGKLNPTVISGAKGVYFWDVRGKKLLDFSSQLVCTNVGHGHPKLIKAIQRQAERICYIAPPYANDIRGLLAKEIARHAPGENSKVFFTCDGAEAVENSVKMARLFTGRHKIIARYKSYHGATMMAITLTGDNRRPPVEPGMTGVLHCFDPYCYRCTFGHTYPGCGLQCAEHIREMIQYEGPQTVAAIIVEPISGANGIIVPPPEYLPRLRQICDEFGILLIADEVMTGWGRTGKWFGVDNWDVKPDLITSAKGINSGYIPLGAVIVSEKVAKYFDDRMFWCGLTYSGHPLACAPGLASMQVLEEEDLVENSRKMGVFLRERLKGLMAKHPCLGDVRGMGLFNGIELVKNRATRERMDGPVMDAVKAEMARLGAYAYGRDNCIYLCPPLVINQEELTGGVEIVDAALNVGDKACL